MSLIIFSCTTQVSDSGHYRPQIMLKVLWSGTVAQIRKISNTGQIRWMNFWKVSQCTHGSLPQQFLTNRLSFVTVYKTPGLTPGRGQNIYNCDYTQPPPPGQVCDVDIKNWHPCTQENNYNYHRSAPCIFLKLNKIYGWIPEYYNRTEELPNNMPLDLKDHIKKIEETQRPAVSRTSL